MRTKSKWIRDGVEKKYKVKSPIMDQIENFGNEGSQ